MRKRLGLLTILLAIPFISGCSLLDFFKPGSNPQTQDVEVEGITLSATSLTLTPGDTATLIATVSPNDATNKTLTWTSSRTSVATVHNGTISAIAAGDATIIASSSNGFSCSCSVHVHKAWTLEEKQIFTDHLYGITLPSIDGLSVEYDENTDTVLLTSETMNANAFNSYVDSVVSLGFSKENGPSENMYILTKDVLVSNVKKCVEIEIFLVDGKLRAACYDPYIYEWREGFIDYCFKQFYYQQPTEVIPDLTGDRYLVETSNLQRYGILIVVAETSTNYEATYKAQLIQNGFNVSDAKDADGYYKAVDTHQLVEVLFGYFDEQKSFVFIIQPANGWPAAKVDFYTAKTIPSGTKVPALIGADRYEFIEASWDAWGYFFVLCESETNFEAAYKESLLDADFIVYESLNTTGNYFAINEANDLLVQYKYIVQESPFGGETYTHTDVIFEPYYPHDEEFFNEKLQELVPGTETVIPVFPGYGEDIRMSDNKVHMFVEIQSCTFSNFETYLENLDNAGWNVKAISALTYQYEAISPNRDVRIETSTQNGRIHLDITGYADEYKSWPTEGVAEILETLGLTGEVPELEGAFGFDYENNDFRHDIVCFVRTNYEQEIVDAYNQKLEDLGWSMVEDGDLIYYVKGGGTVALRAYTEYVGEGKVFIDISFGDDQIYDIDARNAFIYWKIAQDIKAPVQLPGLNITAEIDNIQLAGDEDETYPGYALFELLVSIDSGSMVDAIDEIVGQFVSDGWVKNNTDGYYYKNDLFVNVQEYLGYLAIDICASCLEPTLISIAKDFFYEITYVSTDELPEEIELGSEPVLTLIEYNVDLVNMIVALEFEDAEKLTAGKTAIATAFIAKGWTLKSSSDTSATYIDESRFLKLIITVGENNTLVVQIKDTMFA